MTQAGKRLSQWMDQRAGAAETRLTHTARTRRGLIAAAVALAIAFPLLSHNSYWQTVLYLSFLMALLAVGWNIVSGFTGYASLGQGAFLGVGAYTTALLALHTGAAVWWFVPVGGVAAAFLAALLGVVAMRTRGHAFVIITIALVYICQLVAINWRSLTGGTAGLTLPLPLYGREWQNTPYYYALLVLLVASVALSAWIRRTKLGAGLIAIREDEDKAVAIGINAFVYKVLAFAASAVFTGMAGGVYAYALTFIEPTGMFDILFSVQLVLAALLGGRGSTWGPVLGGFLIEFIDEGTNQFFGTGQVHIVIFGAIMVGVILFLPRGIVPSVQHLLRIRRERREGRPDQVIGPRVTEHRAAPLPAPVTGRTLLETRGLRKRFGGVRAVDGLSLSVLEGSITALIGPNGSGKTTAFNLIHGMLRADSGEITLGGRRVERMPAHRRTHLGLGRTFQIPRLFHETTVLENVVAPLPKFSWRQLATDAVSGAEADRARELLEFVGMQAFASRLAGELSFGQQKLVELAQTLMMDPVLILLDEPTGGVTPAIVERMVSRIRELNQQGKTFLIVEHNLPLVADLCDPVIVMDVGRRIAQGTASEIQRDPVVLDAYLGADWAADEPVEA
jgi:ABC-type branched-subunit amino acid transport system ATPase component/ABC-type branched-subunit amino acid transport system permease subunit